MDLLNNHEKKIIELIIEKDRTLSEISKLIGLSKPATSKYLKKLEEQGILKSTYKINREGRIISYSLKPFHILFSINPDDRTIIYLKADDPFNVDYISLGYISQKEFRDEVKEYLSEVTKVDFDRYIIILYGSVAKGSAHRKSDIDLLFLKENWMKEDKEKILRLLANSSSRCNHKVNPVFKTIKEFNSLDEGLRKEIKDYGIILYEKGKRWNQIKQEMRRYKTITI